MNLWTGLTKVSLFISLSFFVTQCSSGGDDNGLVGKVDTGSCAHTPYVGDAAQTKAKSFRLEHSGYFDKNLVTDHMDALLASSGDNIASYITSQGVELYQMTEKSKSDCKYFAFLKTPTAEAQKNWDNSADKNDEGETFLLGLFTTYYIPVDTDRFELRDPTIMVRQDTQKWTLLHEFAHYLFADGRVRGPMMDRQSLRQALQLSSRDVRNRQQTFEQDPSEFNAAKFVNSLKNFFSLSYDLDQRGPLEEFTVESMLVDRYTNSKLTLVNGQFDLANAAGYMKANIEDPDPVTFGVLSRYSNLERLVKNYQNNHFIPNNWNTVVSDANNLLTDIQSLLSFIDEKMNTAINQAHSARLQPALTSLGLKDLSSLPDAHINHNHFDKKELKIQSDLYKELLN